MVKYSKAKVVARVSDRQSLMVPNRDGSLRSIVVPFVQSANYTPVPDDKPRTVELVVVHCTENAELEGMARMNANLFADKSRSPKASFTYVVDDREIIQCVREEDVAWHAPGCNHNGIGIEIVGRASQTTSQWADDYSRLALYGAMGIVADVCRRRKLLPVFVPAATLAGGGCSGITTHQQVTFAFPNVGHGHQDPGNNFPLEAFINGVQWMMLRLENPMPGDPGYAPGRDSPVAPVEPEQTPTDQPPR